jgi:hypothetical protein
MGWVGLGKVLGSGIDRFPRKEEWRNGGMKKRKGIGGEARRKAGRQNKKTIEGRFCALCVLVGGAHTVGERNPHNRGRFTK